MDNMGSPLNVLLRVPDPVESRARYSLAALLERLGIPFRILSTGEEKQADILYSDNHHLQVGRLFLPCDINAYDEVEVYTHHKFEDVTVWGRKNATPATWDPVGSTFRLLTLLDESLIPDTSRDRRGVFTTDSLSEDRRQVRAEALVENHVSVLRSKLLSLYPRLDEFTLPMWPHGKRYALALTHDTDAITLGSFSEMIYNLAKGFLRVNHTFLRMFKDGLRYIARPNDNPLFGFPRWREIEGDRVRSCFYLFAKPRNAQWDIHDCRSTVVDQKIDWNMLRSMADDGWEFGLHAPINAKKNILAFTWGKRFIEEQLGRSISGLRHHYWALDWRRPYLTFRMHQEAGFRYDSSIAWRDSAGFRAGTCLPYLPFDLERNAPLNIWELPTAVMDGHVCRPSGGVMESTIQNAEHVIRAVQLRKGVIVLDWHTETACNDYQYLNYVSCLLHLLHSILEDSNAWIATPLQLINYWEERRLALQRLSHTSLHNTYSGKT